MQELAPEQLFAGYVIQRVLGRGGMGVVYLARHPRLPRLTALKLLNRDIFDESIQARFMREADNVSQLEHPNIVGVYDQGRENGQLWISMQYVAGGDAAELARAGTVPAERAVRIVAEAGKGLDYAHSHGVLHRDVKPANILLATALPGHDERVLLADFGIAKSLADTRGLTSTGTVLASLPYAAPEQFDNTVEADERADVYSLGCTLFQLLTGVLPYRGTTPMQLLHGHLSAPIPSARQVAYELGARELPAGLDHVIATALAKDRDRRYQTCGELAYAAQAAVADYGRRMGATGYRPAIDANNLPPDPRPTTTSATTRPSANPATGTQTRATPHPQPNPTGAPSTQTSATPVRPTTNPGARVQPTAHPATPIPSTSDPAIPVHPGTNPGTSIPAGTNPARSTWPDTDPDRTRPMHDTGRTQIPSGTTPMTDPRAQQHFIPQPYRPETPAPVADPHRGSARRPLLAGLGVLAVLLMVAAAVLFIPRDHGSASDTPNSAIAPTSTTPTTPVTRISATVSVGKTPTAVVLDAATKTVYVTNSDLNSVTAIDTESHTVTAVIQVGKTPVGLALDADAHTLYTADIGSHSVSAIDTKTHAVVTIPVGKTTARVVVDDVAHIVYAVNPDDNQVTVIDGGTKRVVATIAMPAYPWGMAVDPAAHRLYVAAINAGQVVVVDTDSRQVIAKVDTAPAPGRIAVDPTTQSAYVTHEKSDLVSMIDLTTHQMIRIPVGAKPIGITVDPTIHTVYATNIDDGTISVIDTRNCTVINTIEAGSGISAVAIDPETHTLYATNESDSTLLILEA
ncbi:protein kinase [Nocardia sp. NPDC058658]|uniref:protein kinase domain-containing protein n=1 Tax=Nocardia sp. NPDC058658 TaxID=3346580 RepID=UPI003647DB46